MKKTVVVLADSNPAVISLSSDITNIQKIALIYFRLVGYVAPVGSTVLKPTNLFLKINQATNLRSDVIIASNNLPVTAGTYRPISSDIVPLHTETCSHTRYSGTDSDYLAVWGKQPKGMRWEVKDVSVWNSFQVTLLDQNLQNINLSRAPAYFELVFEVEYRDKINQSKSWRTDPDFMNNMNS